MPDMNGEGGCYACLFRNPLHVGFRQYDAITA